MPLDLLRRLLLPLREPPLSSRYPAEPALVAAAARGLPAVAADRCDRSAACAAVCPTRAIAVAPDDWTIDAGRCIFCGSCVVACPRDAIRLRPIAELATTSREALVARNRLPGGPAEPRRRDTASDQLPAPTSRGTGPTAPAPGSPVLRPDDRLRREISRVLGRSLHVRHLDTGSCNGCDWEMAALLNPYHDVQRLGIDFVASPRHADLLLVTGTMTRNLEGAARRTWEAMAEPRLVVAVGACAISGGAFAGSTASHNGIGGSLPVDVFVPGCPPRPEALIDGLFLAVGRRSPRRRDTLPATRTSTSSGG